MFDPTAFDNMKVVIEGAFYDRDIGGELVITDRNDLVNLAKMSRQFDISFKLSGRSGKVSAKYAMESQLVNLAAELLPGYGLEPHAGCKIRLDFEVEQDEIGLDFKALDTLFQEIWGPGREISQFVRYNPMDRERMNTCTVTVEFARLIGEEQMDDLVEMVDFIVRTLEQLESLIEGK